MKLALHVRKLIWSAAKLRNLILILKPPKLGSGALPLKPMHRALSRQTILIVELSLSLNLSICLMYL